MDQSSPPAGLVWTRAAFMAGLRDVLPMQPGFIAFALVAGTLAAQRHFDMAEALAMSGLVYAGMLQLIALQMWPDHLTLGSIVSLVVVTLTVNSRFVLLGASLRPWFGHLPAWQSYPMLAINTDAGWILSMRYHARGGRDYAYYLSSSLLTWIVWVAATIPGYVLDAWLTGPQRFGLDVVMPSFFTAMLVPLWRGAGRARSWLVAGVTALLAEWLMPGWWFIVVGAIAGALAGAFLDEHE